MSNRDDKGFVLPYVLLVLAILAIVTIIAAERLQNSTDVLSRMQDRSSHERLFATSEAEAVYSLLTGIVIDSAIDLNPLSPVETEFGLFSSAGSLLPERDAEEIERDLWSGQGGFRVSTQSEGDVYIELRDVGGLVSLYAGNEADTLHVLGFLGLSKNKARTLVAKLGDYTDADDNRRFKGAERADYRLRDKPPPTNSPLRNYNELAHVLGWQDMLNSIDIHELQKMTSLQPMGVVRREFATSELLKILGLDKDDNVPKNSQFNFGDLEAFSRTMSDTYRLTFWVKGLQGQYHKRAIEIKRNANGIEKPFRRFWVYEATVLENALGLKQNSINEMKNVIQAESVRVP